MYYKTQREMAHTFGVTEPTVSGWVRLATFPDKHKNGWPRDAVTAWVQAMNERKMARAESTGDKEEKTRLECERLRVVIQREEEVLKQTKIETRRQSKELVNISDVKARLTSLGSLLSGRIESLRQHEVAKHPELKAAVDRFCDTVLEDLRDAM